GVQVASSLTITPGASLNLARPLRQTAVASSRVGTISVNGTLGSSNYVNAINFILGATGIFETSYSGTDQTQGWWYQGNAPGGGTLHASSSVVYNAGGNQNVYARAYGNLVLDGS